MKILGPVDAGRGDGPADARLVAIDHRRVDVPVSGIERGGNRLLDVGPVGDLERSEPEKGNAGAVVEGDGRVERECHV